MKAIVTCCALALLGLGCESEDAEPQDGSGNKTPVTPATNGASGAGAPELKPPADPPAGSAVGMQMNEAGSGGGAATAGSQAMPDEPDQMTAGSSAPEPGVPEEGWETIISAEWELAPNEERYFCQRVTLKEDVYFDGVKAINPLGTHHTALTASDTARGADGLTECNSSGLSPQGIFGSGVGTEPVMYPAGVGLRLRAGQQLLLNLHVYNTTDKPLKGTSGTAVHVTSAAEVEHMAESLLAGPAGFRLPVGRTTIMGKCSMTHDVTLFAVQPHMHQIGVHMKGVAHSSVAGEVMLHDADFNFENQLVYSIDPVEMKKGDVVDVECTFDNTTDGPITFGESSDQEMCFMVLHRYPAAENPTSISCFR